MGEPSMAFTAGLDMTRLDACLQSGEGSAAVNADVAEGDELGVHSTRHSSSMDTT
jgi:predicted DsbA family dithiol-disulfide isomerase